MGYRLLGVSIAGFWLVMMGLQVHREVLPEMQAVPTPGYQAFLGRLRELRVDRMGIHVGGRRVGWTETVYRPIEDGAYQIESRTVLALPPELGAVDWLLGNQAVPGGKPKIGVLASVSIKALVGEDFQLRRFNATMEMGGMKHRVLGVPTGGKLLVTQLTDDSKVERHELPFDSRTILGGLVSPAEYAGRLKLGHAWNVRSFDPLTGRPRTVRRQVVRREPLVLAGKTHDAWVVETRMGEETVRAWVDDLGRLLREERPFGVRLDREDALPAGPLAKPGAGPREPQPAGKR